MKKDKQNKRSQYARIGLTLSLLFFVGIMESQAQSATSSSLQTIYTWVKGVINVALLILCIIKLFQVIYKAFFEHRAFGMDLGMLTIGIVLWALFITYANDILNLFGGVGVTLH